MDNLAALIITMGIPTATTGFLIWLFQRKITKRDKAREAQETAREKRAEDCERNREKLDVMLLQSTTAAIALGEAMAKAVQRIPDAHCNGDMHKALDYAAEIKHQQKDFLTSLGVHALHDD